MLGIYRSTDNGLTWTLRSPPTRNHYSSQGWYDMALDVKPDNPDVVLSSGLDTYRSTNGGTSWDADQSLELQLRQSRLCARRPSRNRLPSHQHRTKSGKSRTAAFSRSANLGSNWTEKNNGFVTFQYYAMGNATLDTALAYGGTQDNGTLPLARQPSPSNPSWAATAAIRVVDYTNNNCVYAEWQNGHRYRSDNGGNSFNSINNGISGDGAWVTPMMLDPFNHLTIYTTTTNGIVWYSSNQGRNSSWIPLGQHPVRKHAGAGGLPVVLMRLYLGSDNSVYRYDPDLR